MSNLVMARIKALNAPLLGKAEIHGRRLDRAAIERKVRDEPSLTWAPEGVEGDPLALSDRLADHVAGAMVPKAKAKALHMLVKLPASVPVETDVDARAALALVVEFAQETFGGQAVFSARMDRDERSLNTVDVFMAPRYQKVTKRASKSAVSLTRFTKLLAEKHGIEDRSDSARGSMQAQGSALQDELAAWLTARGFEAQRGRSKDRDGDDWLTPEVAGARKDRAEIEDRIAGELHAASAKSEAAAATLQIAADRFQQIVGAGEAKATAIVADAAASADETRKEAERDAERTRAAAAADAARDAKTVRDRAQLDAIAIRAEADRVAKVTRDAALRDAAKVRADAAAEVDRQVADAVKDREASLDARERDVVARENRAGKELVRFELRERTLSTREKAVAGLEEQLRKMVAEFEPALRAVVAAFERLKTAPETVRRWLDPAGTVARTAAKGAGILDQARTLVPPKGSGAAPAFSGPVVEGPSLVDQAIAKGYSPRGVGRGL